MQSNFLKTGVISNFFSPSFHYISVISDIQFLWQDVNIQSQDLDEAELMQQPSPNSCAQIDSLMQNAS